MTVNGRPIVENLLKEGMTVKFGDVEFVSRRGSVGRHLFYFSGTVLVVERNGH
jgi:hypothetical protein